MMENASDAAKEVFVKRKARQQLGTLGTGNHFIEVGFDDDGVVWIIVHSGSRGFGHGVASHYMREGHPEGKLNNDYSAFHVDEELGKQYAADLNICLRYALDNRYYIIRRTAHAIYKVVGKGFYNLDKMINRNHNHAELYDDWWIHRKGATHAEAGMDGVIPGNMRDGSFIVEGLGNEKSLYSSSHGAGRVLGRKQAKKTLNVDDFKHTMAGISAKVDESTLDESPFAYKDIFEVMDQQKELVKVVTHVKPIINAKG
jgi:tRNA-splicing ligase RtcB